MNTLPSSVNDALLLQYNYADDTTLVCSGPTPTATVIPTTYFDSYMIGLIVKHSRNEIECTKVSGFVVLQ